MRQMFNAHNRWPVGRTLMLLGLTGSAAVITAIDTTPPPPGRLLASMCFQCHGTDGQAVSGFESITGHSAKDMYEKLLEMSQRRAENIMDLQARGFTPTQLRLIAEYLATLPKNDATLSD